MRIHLRLALAALAIAGLGCESLLAHQYAATESPWEDFASSMAAFDEVEPGRTSRSDLVALGFDPFSGENVAILTYVDVFERFVPNASLSLEQAHPAIRACVAAGTRCMGLVKQVSYQENREVGNFWSNLFTFRVRTEIEGFEFRATLVTVDDRVVYKLWEGSPAVLKTAEKVRPLGPLNDLDIEVKVKFP